ncbi:MAG: hypothetical protein PVH73_08525 [Candidatus Bathyarchaeota archaeon]|jgi:hypothetical protein
MNRQVEKALSELEREVEIFPFYDYEAKNRLKFGQYVNEIELRRKSILEKCADLRKTLLDMK